MSLSIGIVGLPNVGKSTLFNALTKNTVLAANYPFATIEPNTGIVQVPDDKLLKLADVFKPHQVTPATVTFVDIAGLVAGAHKGEGLGNQFLAHIRSVNAICHVVRAFHTGNVIHVEETIEPKRDIETINTELCLADLQTIENRIGKAEKEAKSDPKLRPVIELYRSAIDELNKGVPLSASSKADEYREHVADLHLLTLKPILYLFNIDEEKLSDEAFQSELAELVKPAKAVFASAEFEAQLNSLDEAEAKEFRDSAGVKEPGLVRVIHAAYGLLDLQSFYTAGEKEVRAWTIKKGSTAPEAAGVIHTDFQRGFIAADVVSFDDLIAAGSWNAARGAGKVRTEGKVYVMKPDDVVEFRFNV